MSPMSALPLQSDMNRSAGEPGHGRVRLYAIFDVEHDRDLYELLLAESDMPGCGFEVTGGSQRNIDPVLRRTAVRRRIQQADQVIVICGEHTEDSVLVHSELRAAQDDEKSYFLLWGRRGTMCTKPIGAKRAEGMYSWTRQFLQDQISFNLRKAATDATAKGLRNPNHHA